MRLEIRERRKFCHISVVNLYSLFTSSHAAVISKDRPLVDKNSRFVTSANGKGAKNEQFRKAHTLFVSHSSMKSQLYPLSSYLRISL